uniref:Uncharacterized protein n=1 Tax=Panagrolaimus sp. PS1159 TaxID=55785 RepID=A0AC35GLM3_9BILA
MTSTKSSSYPSSYTGTLHSLEINSISIDQTFTWKISNPFLQIHDPIPSKIYLDDILAIRDSENNNLDSFEILYYPLENRKRIRKRSLITCDDLQNLRNDLDIKLKPPIPQS